VLPLPLPLTTTPWFTSPAVVVVPDAGKEHDEIVAVRVAWWERGRFYRWRRRLL